MPIIGTLAGASARGFGGMRTFGGAWNTAIEYLVVAGGGGGGSFAGGGGGAGGYKTASGFSLELNTSYTVTVGAGGAGGSYTQGTNGVNSVFATITSTGGGGGGGGEFNKTANAGGSGGGASASYNNGSGTGGAASPSGQGNNGGSTSGGTPSLAYGAAGGGGAGAVGGSANSNMAGGAGGNGLSSSISGTSVTRAGGGGGGSDPINGGAGGTGGGGNGGTTSASAGTVNTGSGGGGVWNPSYTAGAGGSGIVIARYSGSQQAYGGTVTSSGGNTIHTFNSSSTFYTGLTVPVSGYSLWLDANDASSFTYSSGTKVSQWNDLSGNGRHFAQATSASQPTRNTNIQNGYAGVIGTANNVLSTSYNWVNSAFTVFLVVKPSSTSGFMGWMGAHTTTGCPALGTANSTGEYSLFRTGVSTNPSNLVATLSNADVAVWKSSGVSGGTVSATIYKNGTQSSTNPGYSSSGTGTIATLFASSTGFDDPCTGYLFEVLVYPSELSDTDRNKVEGYLRAKWGTP